MSSSYTLCVVPTAEQFEFAPDQEALVRTVEVLSRHRYLVADRLGVFLAGPGKDTRETVVDRSVDPSTLAQVLRRDMVSTDQVRISVEYTNPELAGKWWERIDATEEAERLSEEGLSPKDVERVELTLTRLLAVFPGLDQLACPRCGGRATAVADELWGPHQYGGSAFGVYLGLPRSCLTCSRATHPSDFQAAGGLGTYRAPFYRFAISFQTYFYPCAGDPEFAADCLAELSEALGTSLRVWHHHSV